VKVKESYGPDRAEHYNSYLTAAINGAPGKGFSSGQAEEAMARVASDTLPKGMSFEWTDLTFQKVIAGNTAIYIFPLCVLLVFLVLAAPNDFDRVYRRCLATRSIAWRRSRDAARDGYRSVSGMIGVTLLGLFLTPIFYVIVTKLGRKKRPPN
jgi:multidrug efflux pump subunit AcrB